MERIERDRILRIEPSKLSSHPDLASLPMLPVSQYQLLEGAIRDNGILEPLLAEYPAYHVIDGRNRLEIAVRLGLKTVPVIFRDGIDALSYATISALNSRQLTLTGRALFLMDAFAPKNGKAGRERIGHSVADFPETVEDAGDTAPAHSAPLVREEPPSYSRISREFGIHKDYFTAIRDAFNECGKALVTQIARGGNGLEYTPAEVAAVREEEIRLVRDFILEGEVPARRLMAALKGSRVGTGKSASGRGRGAPDYRDLARRSFISLGNAFKEWGNLKESTRQEIRKSWKELKASIPSDIED